MSTDPHAALADFVGALERHLAACASPGQDDSAVLEAADAVADAFEAYEDALLDAYEEVTPLEVYDGEEDDLPDDLDDTDLDDTDLDDTDLDDADEEDDGVYSGFDGDYDDDDDDDDEVIDEEE